MRAIVCTAYGPPDVLELREVETPTPQPDEVRIKIHATSVTASDCIVRGFKLPRWKPIGLAMGFALGFRKPRNPILGMVLAGEVDAVGQKATSYRSGDAVYGTTFQPPFRIRFGAYAEYMCLPSSVTLAPKPEGVSFAEAAAIPYGGLLALWFLQKAELRRGQKVMIYGASGAIGTAAVQLAKHHGAEVTGVCSTTNLEMVRSLGADTVIDYTQEDLSGRTDLYDLVFDAVGESKSSVLKQQARRALTPNGQYVSVDDGNPQFSGDNLFVLNQLWQEGAIAPVIDRVYPLEQMAEAHRYVDTGRKRGSVVVRMAGAPA